MTDYTEMTELSLGDLLPEPLYFRDTGPGGDGARYEVRRETALSTEETVRLVRLRAEIEGLFSGGGKGLSGQAVANRLAEAMKAMDSFIQLIVPGLPPERLATLSLEAKQHISQWWAAHRQQEAAGRGPLGRTAGRATPRGRRSPASSASTA